MGNAMKWALFGSIAVNMVIALAIWRGALGRPATEGAGLAERKLQALCQMTKGRLDRDLLRFDEALARGNHAALQMGAATTNSYTALLLEACTAIKASPKAADEWDEKHLAIIDRYTRATDPTAARAALVEMRDLFAKLGELPNVTL